jgi:hypothetical protein
MALPPLQLRSAEAALRRFCQERLPPERRNEVRLEFTKRGHSFTIIELRAPLEKGQKQWRTRSIARFKFDNSQGLWTLMWCDRNGDFHSFAPAIRSPRIVPLIEMVDEDPYMIFWH